MFKIQTYGKSELALRYFPEASTPAVALNHLWGWIKGCPELMKALSKLKRRKKLPYFTRKEVELIVDYLDEPKVTD